MPEEYTHYKKAKGDGQALLYETAFTLRHFERLMGNGEIEIRLLKEDERPAKSMARPQLNVLAK